MAVCTAFISLPFDRNVVWGKDDQGGPVEVGLTASKTIEFTPPERVSGKHCILTVRGLSVVNSVLEAEYDNPASGRFDSFILTASWSQPASVQYVLRQTENFGAYIDEHDQRNRAIATWKAMLSSEDYPRIIVYIPDGPHPVDFCIRMEGLGVAGRYLPDFENVSFFLEFIPVE